MENNLGDNSLEILRQNSQQKRDSSSRRSLGSIDGLFLTNNSGKVYSEKCLINQKNYLMFQGKRRSLKYISLRKDRHKTSSKSGPLSCDKLDHGKALRCGSNNKSGLHPSTHIEGSDGGISAKARAHSHFRLHTCFMILDCIV